MPIPLKTRAKMNNDPLYSTCALYGQHGHICEGRITREHAIIIGGKKCQKEWAIPPVCAAGHGVDQFQDASTEVPKDMREWVALNRATDKDLQEAVGEGAFAEISTLSKAFRLTQKRRYLNAKYGPYERKFPIHPAISAAAKSAGYSITPGNIQKTFDTVASKMTGHPTYIGGQILYPVSSVDKKIIERAKAQLRASGVFVPSDIGMIGVMIREYGKTLDIVDDVLTGPEDVSRETL